jgi:cobalt-precorrin-5B (C1)-methyltransferase
MSAKALRHGYTTGACAAAAAKGAALMLKEQRPVEEVEITLPAGELARFRLHGQEFTENFASCFVVKDAGDDPDVTNGAEVHAAVTLNSPSPSPPPIEGGGTFPPSPLVGEGRGEGKARIVIEGGIGIGRVTKPGLAVPVGEWAINPVPRRMIEEAVREVFPVHFRPGRVRSPFTVHCSLSIPNGAELAKKTLNERLGIIGGLSVLGTTGIVRPISAKAWTDTIDAAIDVALACGCTTVVLSTGRTSEMVAQVFLGDRTQVGRKESDPSGPKGVGERLPEESYIMMGDHVGYALRACAKKGVRDVIIAGQFAKLQKIACGHEQTHVVSSELDLRTLAGWLELKTQNSKLKTAVLRANTARQVLERSGNDPLLVGLVCDRVRKFAEKLAPGVVMKVLLAGYHGEMLYFG